VIVFIIVAIFMGIGILESKLRHEGGHGENAGGTFGKGAGRGRGRKRMQSARMREDAERFAKSHSGFLVRRFGGEQVNIL
jgi:hypothetical protein